MPPPAQDRHEIQAAKYAVFPPCADGDKLLCIPAPGFLCLENEDNAHCPAESRSPRHSAGGGGGGRGAEAEEDQHGARRVRTLCQHISQQGSNAAGSF